MAFATGCGHKHAKVYAPPPPTVQPAPPEVAKAPPEIDVPKNAKALWVQFGKASWYGAPYNQRRGANGEVYDMNAMTAAHLTLPLNSIVRVTNEKTGHSAIVRITDRGPFVEDRVIDLSLAAAKAVDVWRSGTALVKIEVLETPASIRTGGRWAVQMGGFKQEAEARRIQEKLARRYSKAKVLAFPSPVGDWWVRVRVPEDDKYVARDVAKNSPAPKDLTFLVRLD
ncbi:MAG: septal ring lytic transglycosylase RlpA family protein [Terriglobales bacterium]